MPLSDVWRTLFTNNFDTNKYLYHYTSFESSLKILDTNSLLFSKINNTNDPSEAKIKIIFKTDKSNYKECVKNIKKITDYFTKHSTLIQLLCFSRDTELTQDELSTILSKMTHKDTFYNISGRGFALPRMWAQYGDNNRGVCFIINKIKLLQLVDKFTVFSKSSPVDYKYFYDSYLMTNKKVEDITQKIVNFKDSGSALLKFFNNDEEFIKYNYFEKNENWKNENEFRIITLAPENNDNRISIQNFASSLEGIVLGEQIDNTNEKVIKLLVNSLNLQCEVKRITFNDRLYRLI